jgi:hypothetical protein
MRLLTGVSCLVGGNNLTYRKHLWQLVSFGKSTSKTLVAELTEPRLCSDPPFNEFISEWLEWLPSATDDIRLPGGGGSRCE